jgi:hypothetical protein
VRDIANPDRGCLDPSPVHIVEEVVEEAWFIVNLCSK